MFTQNNSIRVNTGSQYITSANTSSTESIARALSTVTTISAIINLAHEIVANEERISKMEAHEALISKIMDVILEEVESDTLFTHNDIVEYLYKEKYIHGDGYTWNPCPRPTAAASIALERLVARGDLKKVKVAHRISNYKESYLDGFMKL